MDKKGILLGLLSGTLFGVGLAISGMANPAKVRGFLDVTGAWDASLALVMAGALIPAVLGFHLYPKGGRLQWRKAPQNSLGITKSLVAGAALFGAGWGLVGFCPGPALVALSAGSREAVLFVLAMFVGFRMFLLLQKLSPASDG